MAKKGKSLAKLATEELIHAVKKGGKTLDGELEEARRDLVERGNKLVILDAMNFCIFNDIAFPRWLSDAFQLAMQEAAVLRCSWDLVFGRIPPASAPGGKKRGKQAKTYLRDNELVIPVYLKVRERRAQNKRAADFDLIADDIAKEIPGATESIVKRVYYERIKRIEQDLESLVSIAERLKHIAHERGVDLKDLLSRVFSKHPVHKHYQRGLAQIFSQKIGGF